MGRQYLASFVYRAAKAREGFSAVAEHDGISESPTVTVDTGGLKSVFMFGTTPFNPVHAKAVIDDKWALYQAADGQVLRPHTEAFLKQDPRDDNQILAEILSHVKNQANALSFPLILKPNSGSLAKDVFVAKTPEDALEAISAIRQNASSGDYLLAQQYLGDKQGPFPEIRAMCLDGECLIMYERTIDQGVEEDRAPNPAIWGGETIRSIEDSAIKAQVEPLAKYLHQMHDVTYIGFDFKVDREGHIWLLEGNSSPMGLEKIRNQISNGDALIDTLTNRMLDKLQVQAQSVAETAEFFASARTPEVA